MSSPNLLLARPSLRARNSTPSPSPKARTTPITESRSRCPRPRAPNATAAVTAPRTEPRLTLTPNSNAAAPPVKANSAVPCTAKAIPRATIRGASRPATRPSTAPASRALRTNGRVSSVPVPSKVNSRWSRSIMAVTAAARAICRCGGSGGLGLPPDGPHPPPRAGREFAAPRHRSRRVQTAPQTS